mmetsp:Transcript_4165/g.12933  ORF Transcript_4165/g.12933 Transcript_4165/m.12933 type:complete len:245 (+) Transcript_4165:281-1015(+)
MATQREVWPRATAATMATLTTRAKRTFWRMTERVNLARAMASGRRRRSSLRMARSAASKAMTVPEADMAAPTVASLRAGASLTPSPTIRTRRFCWRCLVRTHSSLSWGFNEARTSRLVSPEENASARVAATAAAGPGASPVSMATSRNSWSRSASRASTASGRTGSVIASARRGSSSTDTKTCVAPPRAASKSSTRAGATSQSAAFPTATKCPSTKPVTPPPGTTRNVLTVPDSFLSEVAASSS